MCLQSSLVETSRAAAGLRGVSAAVRGSVVDLITGGRVGEALGFHELKQPMGRP
mgnify:CR=1 FL=1